MLLRRYKLQYGCISEADGRKKTCRTLRDKMNDRCFWNTLCSILGSKPGIRRPFFEADNERSLGDLKRYTWNVLRVHDAWLAASGPQFHFRTLKSPNLWRRTEVLPGGRWLFGLDDDQKALMVDLDSGIRYDLFKLHHPQDREGPSSFQLSFKEGVRSSFRVALFEISRICIYEVDYLADCHPPFQSTHLTTIWDTDRKGFRNSIEISDRYIFQCYSIWGGDDRDEILQLRHLTNDPSVSKQFVERSVAKQGAVSASSLCQHCLMICSVRHLFFPWNVWL